MSLLVMQATVDMYREKIAKLEARLEAVTAARDEACDLFIGLLVEVSSMTKTADSSALRKLVCGDSEWKDMMASHDETIVAATERAAVLRKAGQ